MDIRCSTTCTKSRPRSFEEHLRCESVSLRRLNLETAQINVGRLCNQTCAHCHLEAGPDRKELMTPETARLSIEFITASGAGTVDLTGGAPELNPSFRYLVDELTRLGKRVIVRSNLTALMEPGLEDMPEFFAEKGVEITASLPCYTEENVDTQRGPGTYRKSVAVLQHLNKMGYGQDGSGLILNLVYNPGGSFLPSEQAALEADYKRELMCRAGISFNSLFTITNQPLGRLAAHLNRSGEMQSYMSLLADAFNGGTLPSLMCLTQVSISWNGYIYDCDFNQCLDLSLGNGRPYRLGEVSAEELVFHVIGKIIRTGDHCYACTARAGSSCGGALV